MTLARSRQTEQFGAGEEVGSVSTMFLQIWELLAAPQVDIVTLARSRLMERFGVGGQVPEVMCLPALAQ